MDRALYAKDPVVNALHFQLKQLFLTWGPLLKKLQFPSVMTVGHIG